MTTPEAKTAAATGDGDLDRWWKDAPGIVGAMALLSGVVVYGLLATAYDKFYAELGLTPADVGMQYGKTLGGAAALTTLVFVVMGLCTWAFRVLLTSDRFRSTTGELRTAVVTIASLLGLAVLVASVATGGALSALILVASLIVLYMGSRKERRSQRGRAALAVAGTAAAGVTWLVLSVGMNLYADHRADQIKAGGWVEPPESGGLVFFSVRAMPTRLQASTDTATDKAFAAERADHKLRFLGVANGLLVVYDATTQEALMLPATQFRLPILNCETDSSMMTSAASSLDRHPCGHPPACRSRRREAPDDRSSPEWDDARGSDHRCSGPRKGCRHVSLARVLRLAGAHRGSPLQAGALAGRPEPALTVGSRDHQRRRFRRRLVRRPGDARDLPQHRAGLERPQPAGDLGPGVRRPGLRSHPRDDGHRGAADELSSLPSRSLAVDAQRRHRGLPGRQARPHPGRRAGALPPHRGIHGLRAVLLPRPDLRARGRSSVGGVACGRR